MKINRFYEHEILDEVRAYLSKKYANVSFELRVLKTPLEVDDYFKVDWIVDVTDRDFDYSCIDARPFFVFVLESPFRIWSNELL